MKRYHHKQIEQKWRRSWEEKKLFSVQVDPSKPKYYILDMFPYPSGAGLHVGHVVGYTATDILARYKKARGFNVLHPMGWDSFGLPAEQYAIRTGTHPAETTKKNIATYKEQLSSLGLAYDWDREIATSDPKFYKWTQWIFTKLHERGLAYEAEMLVNFCPALGTVLANEEIEDGLSKIGGHPVERRPLRQWVLKITEYAERLMRDLELVDWPENIKRVQKQWIGRSEGVDVAFAVERTGFELHTFTSCPNTLFGVSYLVIAPEHPLREQLVTEEHKGAIEAYCKEAALKSDLDRTELAKEKTGVFTGSYAINPVNEERIPIWVADYVLATYGTGAVMGVPGHDQRDFEFATKFALPIRPVIEAPEDHEGCWSGEGAACNSSHGDFSINGLSVADAKKKVADWLEEHGNGRRTVNYKLRDWLFSRQRYWGEPIPVVHFEDGSTRTLEVDELPLLPPEVSDYKPTGEGLSPLASVPEWVEITDPKTGKPAKRETNTMPQWAGSCWYYLRYCDPQNHEAACSQDAERYWLPVDMYIGGAEHAVLHLLYARFWHKVLHDIGVVSTPEPFMKLFNQGLVTHRSFKQKGGAYVELHEAEQKGDDWVHTETGEALRSQVEKMSKSKLNVVSPDEIVEDFGADSLRLYEMFMGPLDKEKVWNTDGVGGCRRFLNRLYDLAQSDKLSDESSEEALRLGHRLVDGVEKDLEALQMNTAIAKMMSFLNDFVKLETYSKEVLGMVARVLAPFAPHFAEELWEMLGNKPFVCEAPWPAVDPKYLVQESVTYVVQVNGKVRGRFDLPKDQDEQTIVDLAKVDPDVARHLDGKTIRKVIFVPNRLLNLVVG